MMPVRRSQNWLPSIFNDFFDNELMAKANATAPAINVIETDKAYKLELAAPGMTKEDFSVRIDEENNLVISMEKKAENKVAALKSGCNDYLVKPVDKARLMSVLRKYCHPSTLVL